jgi:hypothetical protein
VRALIVRLADSPVMQDVRHDPIYPDAKNSSTFAENREISTLGVFGRLENHAAGL